MGKDLIEKAAGALEKESNIAFGAVAGNIIDKKIGKEITRQISEKVQGKLLEGTEAVENTLLDSNGAQKGAKNTEVNIQFTIWQLLLARELWIPLLMVCLMNAIQQLMGVSVAISYMEEFAGLIKSYFEGIDLPSIVTRLVSALTTFSAVCFCEIWELLSFRMYYNLNYDGFVCLIRELLFY